MNLTQFLRRSERVLVNNSPVILTAIGATGAVATAFLTGRASYRAAEIIVDAEREHVTEPGYIPTDNRMALPLKEKARLVWPLFVPAVSTGVVTVAAIIFANRIGTRRAAALATAYGLSERAFAEYKDKVVEKIGATKEQAVRSAVAQDHITETIERRGGNTLLVADGKSLCIETYTGRVFETSVEDIKKAVNDTNYQMRRDEYASLGDFQQRLGLSRTDISDEVGWRVDTPMDVEINSGLTPDQKPCLTISYTVAPVRNYHRFH